MKISGQLSMKSRYCRGLRRIYWAADFSKIIFIIIILLPVNER